MEPTTTASDVDGKFPADVASASLVGTILSGRYRVLSRIGAGGMGEVYAAEHRLLGSKVALKTLSPSLRGNLGAEHRFRQEAELGSELCHPNLVRVFDFEVAGPVPYFVMELLQGQDLRSLLDTVDVLPIDRGVGLVLEALAGLALAHERGIVHRDLKPSNLFVVEPGPREQCKLLDFGVARVSGRTAPSVDPLTLSNRPIGTLAYMAPEQIRSARDVDARADVYSACAILLEALSGQKRFETDSVPEQIFRTLNETAPRLDAFVQCPAELANVIERGLSRNREDRHADAATLARTLEAFVRQDSAPAPVVPAVGSSGSRRMRIVTVATAVVVGAGLATVPRLMKSSSVPIAPQAPAAAHEQQALPPPSSPPPSGSTTAAPGLNDHPPQSSDVTPLAPLGTAGGTGARTPVRPRVVPAGKPPMLEPARPQPPITVERGNPYE